VHVLSSSSATQTLLERGTVALLALMASDKSKILRLKAWENLLKAQKDLITAARQERIAMKARL
jgi:hypothetical protein